MRLSLLRIIDKWIGAFLLLILAAPARLISLLLPAPSNEKPRYVFVKLKGGGSLIIAMPALLGLRRKFPQAEFVLVCAREAKIYAELTGLFDSFSLIDDASIMTLAASGIQALRAAFRAAICVDLEPNSWFAALFTMLTCAKQRLGLVKPEQAARALAYSRALSYNAVAPLYIYHDRICEMLGAAPVSAEECRQTMRAMLPSASSTPLGEKTIALAAFTSDFARERMMPAQNWGELLRRAYGDAPLHILIFGSVRNIAAAAQLKDAVQPYLPAARISNLAGVGSLAQTTAQIALCAELWAIDSGLLHIARLLGIPTRSFWGPTMPAQRLRPIAELKEQITYRPFLCSPCIQATTVPPCSGNNLCMISMTEENPDLHPAWIKKR